LVVVNKTDKSAPVEFTYRPISYGKLRLFLQFTAALSSMQGLGFTAKDTDEVKGIFVDTNMVTSDTCYCILCLVSNFVD
jgi:hypothetical protein